MSPAGSQPSAPASRSTLMSEMFTSPRSTAPTKVR